MINKLTENIKTWSKEKGLDKAEPAKQMLKLVEELGELAEGMAKDRPEQIKDSIGDVYVVLTILKQQLQREKVNSLSPTDTRFLIVLRILGRLANDILSQTNNKAYKDVGLIDIYLESLSKSLNLDFEKCVECAYNEIKDRKGQMVDGVFVKESDLSKENKNE